MSFASKCCGYEPNEKGACSFCGEQSVFYEETTDEKPYYCGECGQICNVRHGKLFYDYGDLEMHRDGFFSDCCKHETVYTEPPCEPDRKQFNFALLDPYFF